MNPSLRPNLSPAVPQITEKPHFHRSAMRSTFIALAAALSASHVAAHATFQDLWVNGVDFGETCVRMPQSNSPLTDVSANSIRCNVNRGAVGPQATLIISELH